MSANARTQADQNMKAFADDIPALGLKDIRIVHTTGAGEDLVIAEDFTLDLFPGHMHCLAGRSGSGKTSILRVAAAMAAPSGGIVLWNGQSVELMSEPELARYRRRTVSYVDQGGALVDGLTAHENVLLSAVADGRGKKMAREASALLEELGLEHVQKSLVNQLSGGERQRTAIARALLLNPLALILDEPTASLDRATANTVIETLNHARNKNHAILVASHDPNLIAAADTVTELN